MKLFKPCIILFIGTLILSVMIVSSCKKSDSSILIISEDATIIDRGDIAADGCGWQIITKTDSTYVPQNLNSQFQINNLPVHITYHKLKTRYYCGQVANNPGSGITEIQLDNIITP